MVFGSPEQTPTNHQGPGGPGYEWVRRGGTRGKSSFKEQEFSAEGRGQRQGAPGSVCTLTLGVSVSVAGWHWGPVAVGTEGTAG